MASPMFVPECPECRYDLTGLPDSKCPECGIPFSHATLRALWHQKHHPSTWPWAAADVLCIFSLVALLLAGLALSDERRPTRDVLPVSVWLFFPFFTGSWVLAGAWWRTVRQRNADAGAIALLFILLSFGALVLLVSKGQSPGEFAFALALYASCWVISLAAARSAGSFAPCLIWLHATLLLASLMVATDALAELAVGIHWSRWPDPRRSQPYFQYPLTTGEAAAVGTTALAISLITTIPTLYFRFRWLLAPNSGRHEPVAPTSACK